MKNFTILFLSLFTTSLAAQQILSVRQGFDDGVTTFSDIQAAVDAANSNDWIYVYPGVYVDDVTINKAIRLIGPGFRLNDNYPNSAVFNTDADLVGELFVTGTEGVLIEGLKLRTVRVQAAESVVIQRCWVYRAAIDNSIVRIKAVYFSGGSWSSTGGTASENQLRIIGHSEVIILNSILHDTYSSVGREVFLWAGQSSDGATGSLIIDRCFLANRMYFGRLAVVVKNSFAYTYGATQYNGISLNRYNNFTASNWGGNNTTVAAGTLWDSVLAGYVNNPNSLSFDARYQLSESSLATGAADDGGDCGPFGGSSPYILSGVPALPFIYKLAVPEEASTGGGIDVNIKVRTPN